MGKTPWGKHHGLREKSRGMSMGFISEREDNYFLQNDNTKKNLVFRRLKLYSCVDDKNIAVKLKMFGD